MGGIARLGNYRWRANNEEEAANYEDDDGDGGF